MNILVIGGSGFVSGHVINAALEGGSTVYYLTRGNREPVKGAIPVIADRNDPAAVEAAIEALNVRFDAVLDCICFNAAQALDDIKIFPRFTDRIVVISTDSLYHPDFKAEWHDESCDKFMEDDSYGGRKRAMEKVFIEQCPPALKYTLFRPPHMYGAGSQLGIFPMHTRQRDLIEHIKSGKPITLVGGGEQLIQPLHARDLADAILASIKNEKCFNEIFGIAGPDVISNREYFEILGRLLDAPVSVESCSIEEYNVAHDDGYLYFCRRVYCLDKLKAAGLPVPRRGLEQGLRETIEFLQSK